MSDQQYFIVQHKNTVATKRSASGGAFYGIAEAFLKTGGVVFGAAVTPECKYVVSHIEVSSTDCLYKLQNSKYVQSNIGDTFINVAEYLKQGRKVLFSGTPCQIAGLYGFLGEKKDNLTTVDLVCHGVPSPGLLKSTLKEEEKILGETIKTFSFRSKNRNFLSSSIFVFSVMTNKKEVRRLYFNDFYYNTFMNGLTFRESCYVCKWANMNRISDFTIGDAASQRMYKEFHPYESNSLLIINTNKGKKIWNKIRENFDYKALDIDSEKKLNHQLLKPVKRSSVRDYIYEEFQNSTHSEIRTKYARPFSLKDKIILYISLCFPGKIVSMLGKLINLVRGKKNV